MPLAPNETRDPDAVPIPCEADGCDTVKPRGQMYSIKLTYMLPGAGIPAFECGAGQHYGCTPEHAESAAAACLSEHMRVTQRKFQQQPPAAIVATE